MQIADLAGGGFLGATFPALAILFSRIMNAFGLPPDEMIKQGNFYALMFFVIALGNLVAYAILGWLCNVIAQAVIKFYRLEMFNNFLRQDMTFFDRPGNTTGALVSRLSTEPAQIQELLSFNIGLLLIIIVNLSSSCILAIIIGWKLGLVLVLGALPFLVSSGYVKIRLEAKLDEDTSSRFADSAGVASEAVMAIRTVSSLVMERDIIDKFEQSLHNIATTSVKSMGWTMFWYALSQSISFLCMALGFWYGGRLISFGEYTVAQFYTIFIAVIFSGEAAAQFFQFSTSITKATSAANYVLSLRQQAPIETKDDYPPGAGDEATLSAPSVDYRDLEFHYPLRPEVKVLRGVTREIQSGQFVAFVGASGCGKTTMVSLLERFYDPTAGTISLDGVDAATVHLGQHRRGIALVQQEPVLYQGTIRENIALGIQQTEGPRSGGGDGGSVVADDEILAACRQANIEAFVLSLPEGLETQCGSQGLQLSGGQRQRIAIARALVRRPRLLLLDEATSSLDTESERAVQAALDAAAKGEEGDGEKGRARTTVAVAHRLSTVKNADLICVFSHGRIVEAGSHEELLEKRGMYYEMCLGQSLDKAA